MNYSTFKTVLASLAFAATLLMSAVTWSAGVVIVHPSNTNTLSESDIARIFLGKKTVFPNGSDAIPIEHRESSPLRSSFLSKVLDKSDQQIKAYWAQQLFTGKGRPPKKVGDSADVRKLVAQNPALIGYIDAAMADDSVKVVFSF